MLDEIRVLLHIPPADFLLVFVCIMYVRFGQILGQAILGHPCRGGHCIAGRSVASPTGVTTPPCQKCNGIPCRHGDGNADVAQEGSVGIHALGALAALRGGIVRGSSPHVNPVLAVFQARHEEARALHATCSRLE